MMDDQQQPGNQGKLKLLILILGVTLLGAGVFVWLERHDQQSEQAGPDLESLEQTHRRKPAVAAANGTAPSPMATSTTSAADGGAPVATATGATPDATPGGATPAATTTGATPATPVTTTASPVPATTSSAAPDSATKTAATTPATTPVPATTTAATPPAPSPVAEAPKPPIKPLIASAPPSPVAPALPVPPPESSPLPVAPPEPPPNPNAMGVERLKKRFSAVKRDEVVAEAKQAAGRSDPMMPFLGGHQFPHYSKGPTPTEEPKDAAASVPPPPPTPEAPKSAKSVPPPPPSGLVPPPPPSDPIAGAGGDLPLNQLPEAPDKPTVADKLKLAGVIGNKVILQVPTSVRQQNKWPATISLAPGEQFESLSVVSVDGDSVTLDEDGERRVLTLAAIK